MPTPTGARVRIVDPRRDRRPSRALVVHPRTLEQLRPLGVLDALRARSLDDPQALVHLGPQAFRVRLDELRVGSGPLGHPWMVRQQDVEDVLAEALVERGVAVERGPALEGLCEAPDEALALLRGPGGEEGVRARWIAGCDGASSNVRRLAGIP